MEMFKDGRYSVVKAATKHGVWGIIFGVLLIALGVLLCVTPLVSTGVIIWAVIGVFGIGCIIAVVKFIFPGDGKRDGLLFALAILVLLLIAGLITAACLFPEQTVDGKKVAGFAFFTGRLVVFFAVFFGLCVVIKAIYTLFSIGSVESGKGWVIAYAIISIIVGILMAVFPFFWTIVGAIIAGIYAIAGGIGVIVISCKGLSVARKEKKELDKKE